MRISILSAIVLFLCSLSSFLYAGETPANPSGEFIPFDKPPQMISSSGGAKILPEYPATAKKDSVEGTVYVSVRVEENGSTSDLKITRGVREDLDQSALNYVKKLTFTPAESKGKPVAATVTIPVRFKLVQK